MKMLQYPMTRIRPLVLVLCLLSAGALSAQDMHFTQFYMSPLTQNPAFAGSTHDMRLLINYKEQWHSVGSSFKTVACSYDMRFRKRKTDLSYLAAGINVFSDKAGDGKAGTAQGSASLAYHLYVGGHNRLSAGLQAGYAQRSMNFSAFQWGNQYDVNAYNASLASGEPAAGAAFGYADLGGGALWTFNNASGGSDKVANNHELMVNVGAAFSHVNRPNYSFYKTGEKLYMKTVLQGNALIGIPYSSFSIVPGIIYSMQGPERELFAGGMIRYTTVRTDIKYGNLKGLAFSLGGFMRAKDAFAATTLLEYSHLALGMSYDFNVSGLRAASGGQGGFEIALRYVLPDPFQFKSNESSFY